VKLHGLRHLNICVQLDAGVTETVIAMRVGHRSPALIRSTYGHLVGTVGRRAGEATAALVPRTPIQTPSVPMQRTAGPGSSRSRGGNTVTTQADQPWTSTRTVGEPMSNNPDSVPVDRCTPHRIWTPDAVRGLGLTTDVETAGEILGIGRSKVYELAKDGQFPVKLLRIGRRYIVPVAALLRLLDVE
jgi:hypothetical protein